MDVIAGVVPDVMRVGGEKEVITASIPRIF